MQSSWGKTDISEGNEKDSKRTVKISELIYWLFFSFLIKYSVRTVSIRWRREPCKLILFPEEKLMQRQKYIAAVLSQAVELKVKYESAIFGQIELVDQLHLLVKLKAV